MIGAKVQAVRLAAVSLMLVAPVGCAPLRVDVETIPPQCLQVLYQPSSSYTSCLVASVVMTGNYVEGAQILDEFKARREIKELNLDETRIGDIRKWLSTKRLVLMPMAGKLSDRPPLGLGYWLKRGYPVICIINQKGGNPDYNHAVVVIGVEAPPETPINRVEKIYYLDPSTPKRVESCAPTEFLTIWDRAQQAMLLIVKKPRQVASRGSVR